MSDFKNVGSQIYNQAINETSTTQKAPLGTTIRAVDIAVTAYGEGEFVYAIGVASTVVGSVALINADSFQTSLAVAGNRGQIGLAMSINVAGSYGWYQVKGKGVAKVLASFADNAICYLTATDGSIDDAVVTGDVITGMKGASAIDTPSTGLAEIELDYPQASGATLGDLGITSTAAELNILDGVTSTTAELNILDGVTSTTAELNILDGVTATAAEINLACDESANTEIVTTTNVLTAAESGKTLILNSATAFVTTLPAVAAGLRFNFYCGATGVTGGNHTIVPDGANDDTIYGSAEVAGAVVAASAEGSINLIADKFIAGDHLSLFCDGTNWYVQGSAVTSAGVTFTT